MVLYERANLCLFEPISRIASRRLSLSRQGSAGQLSKLGELKTAIAPSLHHIPFCSPHSSALSAATMEAKTETSGLGEKHADPEHGQIVVTGENVLQRKLQGRHMQMIAM
jgi:hypothetical protein